MMSSSGAGRLRAKPVLGCAGMCVFVTLVCLLGGRLVRARAESQRGRQAELLHAGGHVESQVRSGTESGLSFLLMGSAEERSLSMSKLDAAAAEIRNVAASPSSAT